MSAPTLPRYHATSLEGWPISAASLNRVPGGGGRKARTPVLWQIQDSWNNWKVVAELGFHRHGEAHAQRRAEKMNFEHEQWLRERGLWKSA